MRRTPIHATAALAFMVGVALLIPAGRAFAHAGYDHSSPAKDDVVPTAPAQVDAYFKQTIFKVAGEYYLRVFADDNTTQVSQGDGTVDDNDRKHMFTALPAGLSNGRYIVHWKTKSDADGDTDSGMYCFYIGVQPTTTEQAQCASFAPTPVPTLGGTAQATSAATSAATRAATAVSTPPGKSDTGGGGSVGVIVGVVVGAIMAVIVVVGAGLWWRSRQA